MVFRSVPLRRIAGCALALRAGGLAAAPPLRGGSDDGALELLSLNQSGLGWGAGLALTALFCAAAFLALRLLREMRAHRIAQAALDAERAALERQVTQRTAGLQREVEERRGVELALAEGRYFFDAAQRIARLGFWQVDMDRRTLRLSRELVEMLHDPALDPDGAEVGLDDFLARYVHPHDAALFVRQVSLARERAGDPGFRLDFEHRALRGDGTVISFAVTGGYLPRSRNFLVGFAQDSAASGHGLERLRRAKAAAERGSRMRSRFISTLGNELRTPLSGIVGIARMLERTPLTLAQRDLLDALERGAGAALGQLSEIAELARLEAGRVELRPGPTDLRGILYDAVALFLGRTEEKGLRLELEIDEELPEVLRLDGRRIAQVVHGLLAHTLNFTEAGALTLHAGVHAGRLRIAVAASEARIDPALSEALLDPLAREADSLAGAGLGLAIAHRLAEAMEGRLRTDGGGDEGSRLTLELPCEQVAAEGVAPGGAAILLVDDDPLGRIVAAGILESLGHRVITCPDGPAALRRFGIQQFDLVMVDLRMPGMSGTEFASALRQRHPEAMARTPLVALGSGEVQERALFDGVAAVPLDELELSALLRRLLPARAASHAPAEPVPASRPSQPPEPAHAWPTEAVELQRLGAELAVLAEEGTWEAIAAKAHRLASSARAAGLAELHALAERVAEEAAAGSELLDDALAELAARLPPALEALRIATASFRQPTLRQMH